MCVSGHCSLVLLESSRPSRNESPKQSSVREVIACVTKNQTAPAVHYCTSGEGLSFAAPLIGCKLGIWCTFMCIRICWLWEDPWSIVSSSCWSWYFQRLFLGCSHHVGIFRSRWTRLGAALCTSATRLNESAREWLICPLLGHIDA